TRINGFTLANLARLNSDGSLDTNFTARANQPVTQITVLPDNRLLVRGYFSSLGRPRNGLGILLSDGTVDDSFLPRVSSSGSLTAAIALPDGQVLIGGYQSLVTGVTRRGLAMLHADGTVNTNFNAGLLKDAYGNLASVNSLALLSDGKILVSGS